MNIKNFYKTARKLKDIKRSGWIERGVKGPESVSDHSFMVAILCLVIPNKNIDRNKAVKMSLVHDLAESEVGDLITKEHWKQGGKISRVEKAEKEEKALEGILSDLTEDASKGIMELWKELEEGKTDEAAFVKDVDTLERILQAMDYNSKRNYEKPLEVFWDNKNKDLDVIKDENIRKFLENIINEGW